MKSIRNDRKKLRPNVLIIAIAVLTLAIVVVSNYTAVKSVIINSRASSGKTLTVCSKSENCSYKGGEGLQRAFYEAADGDIIEIKPGIYENPGSVETVQEINWRICQQVLTTRRQRNTAVVTQEDESHHFTRSDAHNGYTGYSTSYIIKKKNNLTIRGESPRNTIIKGTHVHGVTIEDSSNIVIERVSIVANGNTWENGTGDSAIHVRNSTGTLSKSIVTGNKTTTNPLKVSLDGGDDTVVDQEGIFLSGSKTNFNVYHNLITNNFHTGIMLTDGADAHIVANLITNNGYDTPAKEQGKGQGISLFYDNEAATICREEGVPYFDGDFSVRIWNNIITDNSGNGVFARGDFKDKLVVSHNTFNNNTKAIKIGGPGGKTVLHEKASVFIASNLMTNNRDSGIEINGSQVENNGASILIAHNNSHGNKYSNYKYVNMTASHKLNAQPNNLESQATTDKYFRLPTNSPLKTKGYNKTDISSYSNGGTQLKWAEFNVETYTLLLERYYPEVIGAIGAISK